MTEDLKTITATVRSVADLGHIAKSLFTLFTDSTKEDSKTGKPRLDEPDIPVDTGLPRGSIPIFDYFRCKDILFQSRSDVAFTLLKHFSLLSSTQINGVRTVSSSTVSGSVEIRTIKLPNTPLVNYDSLYNQNFLLIVFINRGGVVDNPLSPDIVNYYQDPNNNSCYIAYPQNDILNVSILIPDSPSSSYSLYSNLASGSTSHQYRNFTYLCFPFYVKLPTTIQLDSNDSIDICLFNGDVQDVRNFEVNPNVTGVFNTLQGYFSAFISFS